MLPSPCYVFSDTHLGFAPAQVERELRGFLGALRGRAGSLVINGDLFEFWFEWRRVMPRPAFRVLAALADLRDAGIPVLMIAGNHDCWGGEILRDDVGIDYQVGPWHGEMAGWRTYIEHGDGLRDREDRRYRALRAVLRHRLAIGAFRWLHPDWATALAGGSSHASRSYAARDGGRGLRDVAARRMAAEPNLELVVYGHSHVPTVERLAPGGVYANAGSWLDAPTFLRVTPERVELRRWDGSAEGMALDVVDRAAEKALP
ncbi:MAG TPA: UDP-2,3-diacylglucosamine diphosphatase [Gemmatimonadaceae bacterium]|nr:UDP-2,3-diacylglucosamine diphosphatase [Gemmatimonadaceae bacterium]